jgi:molybdate/tungstate transport system substrate-binding protein
MPVSRRSALSALGTAVTAGAFGSAVLGDGTGPSRIDALVAGSLLPVADEVPGATVEAHGSAAVRRLVVEGARRPDAVALADPRLFDGISARGTLFATNALVVAYDPGSAHAAALAEDWRRAVARPEVRVGRTDPRRDPLGYRTVMALRLLERRSDLAAARVLDGSRVFPETDLLNALEAGGIDAAFAYRNMAVQRDLPSVPLPDAVDFSSPDHADRYATVSYALGDRRIVGAPIRYAATATTPAGETWVERLVTARRRLRTGGFGVPDAYPVRDRRLGSAGAASPGE